MTARRDPGWSRFFPGVHSGPDLPGAISQLRSRSSAGLLPRASQAQKSSRALRGVAGSWQSRGGALPARGHASGALGCHPHSLAEMTIARDPLPALPPRAGVRLSDGERECAARCRTRPSPGDRPEPGPNPSQSLSSSAGRQRRGPAGFRRPATHPAQSRGPARGAEKVGPPDSPRSRGPPAAATRAAKMATSASRACPSEERKGRARDVTERLPAGVLKAQLQRVCASCRPAKKVLLLDLFSPTLLGVRDPLDAGTEGSRSHPSILGLVCCSMWSQ